MGLISKLKEAVSHDDSSSTKAASVDVASTATVVDEPVVATATASKTVVQDETDISRAVTEAADAAAAKNVTVVEQPADVTVIDKGVEDVQIRQNEARLRETENVHERVEVQQEITKDVEETEIQQVYQPIVDNQAVKTEESTTLPTQHREEVQEIDAAAKAQYESQAGQYESFSKTGDVSGETVVNAPNVREVHRKHVITEVTPVIERTIDHVHVVKTTQPIKEHVQLGAKVQAVQVNAPVSIEEYNAQVAKGQQINVDSTAAVATATNAAAATTAEATTLREI